MQNILLIAALLLLSVLALWLAFLEWRHQRLARSFRALMTGSGGADLESTLYEFVARLDQLEQNAHATDQRVGWLEAKHPYLVQHVGVVRFNPFPDKGGDQSFVVAILDDAANGAVITSLQSRVDTRLYAKPVVAGQSTYTLTGEEREAIARAMKPRV